MSAVDGYASDADLIDACLDEERGAWDIFMRRYDALLKGILVQRGATPEEAEDVVGHLWARCVPGEDHPSLLERYNGKASLKNWLVTIATNRLTDLKRRQSKEGELPVKDASAGTRVDFDELADERDEDSPDSALVELLRQSLRRAFASLPAEEFVLVRLVYFGGVRQRALAQVWGCHESRISKRLGAALECIRVETLRFMKEDDPWLQLEWEDFLNLCDTSPQLFSF